MASGPGRRAALAALVAAILTGGCSPARAPVPSIAPTPAPAPEYVREPLGAAGEAAFAALLRLEDRREYDPAALAAFAASSAPRVRARAALALARLARPEALPLLRRLLADPDSSVSATAAFALGQVGDTSAVPALAALLAPGAAPEIPTVAAEAAYALGKLRSAGARDALHAYLDSADPETAAPAVAGSALLALARHPAATADSASLLRWAAAPDPGLRWRATYTLVRRPVHRPTRALLDLAGDPDPRVRALALRGLSAATLDSTGVPHAEALPRLAGATGDPDYAVRISAARALGGFPDPAAVATLRALLATPDRHLVATALESLGRIGADAAGAAAELETIVSSVGAPIFHRQTALESLARVDPPRGRALAARLAGAGEWRIRAASARALAGPGPTVAPALRELVADPDPRVAGAALQAALDAAGDSIAPLRSLLVERVGAADPFVRAVALGGLARLADPATLPLLLDAFDSAGRDTVPDAALAALDALAALRAPDRDPARAFFARFPRSPDPLVRRRALDLFGAGAAGAWGDPTPVETVWPAEVYERVTAAWSAPVDPARARPEVEVVTDRGALRLRLHGDDAPLTTESFLSLAARGFFDGQEWPRVVPDFVVQGGDPRGDTNGGPGYAIRDEINRHRYLAGRVGMALAGPDTGGSQFFVTHSPQPHLDGTYTLFGEVVQGMQILEEILPGDLILSVRAAP